MTPQTWQEAITELDHSEKMWCSILPGDIYFRAWLSGYSKSECEEYLWASEHELLLMGSYLALQELHGKDSSFFSSKYLPFIPIFLKISNFPLIFEKKNLRSSLYLSPPLQNVRSSLSLKSHCGNYSPLQKACGNKASHIPGTLDVRELPQPWCSTSTHSAPSFMAVGH